MPLSLGGQNVHRAPGILMNFSLLHFALGLLTTP
jgi:hypothetical protein